MDEMIDGERADARRLRTMPYGEAADIIMRKTEGRFAFPVSDRINDTTAQGGVRMTIEVGLCKVEAIVHEVRSRIDVECRMGFALGVGEDLRMPDLVTLVSAAIPGQNDATDDLFVFQCGRKPIMLVTRSVHAEFVGEEKAGLTPADLLQRARAKAEYLPLMRLLSAITVRDVRMNVGGQGRVDPSFTKGEIRISLNTTPPGEHTNRDVALLYDVPLDARLVQFVCPGAVPGRGRVARDAEGEATVQVVGDDVYLLFPVFTLFNEGSVKIFRKALSDAYALWRSGPPEVSTEPDDLRKAITGIESLSIEIAKRELAHYVAEIDRLQANLSDMYASRTVQIKRIELLQKGTVGPADERADADLSAIIADPRVERVEAVDNGLHIITKKVVIEHEGDRYALGAYTLRIGQFLRISMWTNGPTHPRGMAHPHIDPGSGPCYGNAGQAIIRAAGEGRVGDAVRFALTWLFDGYDAPGARTKIEEWPKADENGDPIPLSAPTPPPPLMLGERQLLAQLLDKAVEERHVKVDPKEIEELLPAGSVTAIDEDEGSLEVAP